MSYHLVDFISKVMMMTLLSR
jgi:hypothetical protein